MTASTPHRLFPNMPLAPPSPPTSGQAPPLRVSIAPVAGAGGVAPPAGLLTPPVTPLKPSSPGDVSQLPALQAGPTKGEPEAASKEAHSADSDGLPHEPLPYTGTFRQGELLGEGQWSRVYAAHATDDPPAAAPTSRMLAIKTPRRSRTDNAQRVLRREARILSFLAADPAATQHVVPFFGFYAATGSLVLAHVPHTLESLVRRLPADSGAPTAPRVGTARFVRLARALVAAMAWLHEQGVVHGDVKPGNVLVAVDGADANWTPFLADFSSAHRYASPTPPSPLDAFTTAYAAPEFLTRYRLPGGGIATRASDAWSLAATLLFAGTGREPYAIVKHALGKLTEAKRGEAVRWAREAEMEGGGRRLEPKGVVMGVVGRVLVEEERRMGMGEWREKVEGMERAMVEGTEKAMVEGMERAGVEESL